MSVPVQSATALYLHVPFCASSCDFCSFYQEQPKRGEIDRYLAAIEREMELYPPGRVETAFWGGGTPGLLPAEDLLRLGKAMTKAAGQPGEWSVELAPSSVRADKLAALKEIGVTRVSMGVQSFDDATLDALGRRHSPKQIMEAWELIEAAGFASRNLDLIFAIPGQDEKRWTDDLHRAISLKPDHLSTYCLTFEEDTAMFVKLSQGKVKIDRELEARLYRRTWETLEKNGYAQYETSNFARAGHACRHNLITWEMGAPGRWARGSATVLPPRRSGAPAAGRTPRTLSSGSRASKPASPSSNRSRTSALRTCSATHSSSGCASTLASIRMRSPRVSTRNFRRACASSSPISSRKASWNSPARTSA